MKCNALIILAICACFNLSSEADRKPHDKQDIRNNRNSEAQPRIVIIGAGISGLFAAYLLNEQGYKNVILLEARHRVGGRIKTIPYDESFLEVGAEYLHFPKFNDAFFFLQKFGEGDYFLNETQYEDYHHSQFSLGPQHQKIVEEIMDFVDVAYEECGMIWDDWVNKGDLHGIPPLESSLGEFIIRRCKESCPVYDEYKSEAIKKALLDVGLRIASDYEGEDSFKVSALLIGRPSNEFGNDEYIRPKNGYRELLDLLVGFIPKDWIRLNKKVTRINYEQYEVSRRNGVLVSTEDGARYLADHVLVTLPIGVLKADAAKIFSPRLPYRKMTAIRLMNSGRSVKLTFKLETLVLWDADDGSATKQQNMFPLWLDRKTYEGQPMRKGYGHGSSDISQNWMRYIAYVSRDENNPYVWTAWVFGDAAEYVETIKDEEVVEGLEHMFQQALPNIEGLNNPEIILRTSWISDPYTRGGYSNIPPSCDAELIWTGDLAEPVKDSANVSRILFGGEATSTDSIATVHGSMKSSRREVERIVAMYK